MVKKLTTKGKTVPLVSFELRNVNEVLKALDFSLLNIEEAAERELYEIGLAVEEQVKLSIAGKKAEPKSVDTGLFLNSIKFKKTGKAEGVVFPERKRYPNSSKTTEDIAGLMEYWKRRRHFRNSAHRVREKMRDRMANAVNKAIKFKGIKIGIKR